MVLVDFSHLVYRTLFVAIYQNGIQPSSGDKLVSSDYKGFFYHLLFQSLGYTKRTFSKEYGEIVLCFDSPKNWRKEIFQQYKGHRKGVRDKSSVDFGEFYQNVMTELENKLLSIFPFKVVKVDLAEGDDVIACLSKEFHLKDKILVISEDKDMRQVLKYDNCKLYKPIDKSFVDMTLDEVKEWEIYHILFGDREDGIPSIKSDSIFSVDFLKYAASENVFEREVSKFRKLDYASKMFEDFEQKFPDKKIYKSADFGEKGVKKFIEEGVQENLAKNEVWAENFERNKVLISFDCIPIDIHKSIVEAYYNANSFTKPMSIMEFFTENRLSKNLENINDFISEEKSVRPMDEWF
jgi:5'-3' exonuclease